MSTLIEEFLDDLARDTAMSEPRRALLRELLVHVVEVANMDAETKDLRVAVTAINELLAAFVLFDKFRDRSKLTVFGSARTQADHPLYHLAEDLSEVMAARGWITVSGAGPGIMEASARGAGRASVLGVNIELPFEQTANSYIDAADMLVTMKYFFTRKVALTRPSMAFVVLPGGYGTMDELFEVITLLHTGKTDPAPVVLLDTPDGTYWRAWLDFVQSEVVAGDYIGPLDTRLVRLCTSVEDSVSEIEHFFSNYRGFTITGERATMALHQAPTELQLNDLRADFPLFNHDLGYQLDDPHHLSFSFDGRNYVTLRLVIDAVNSWTT